MAKGMPGSQSENPSVLKSHTTLMLCLALASIYLGRPLHASSVWDAKLGKPIARGPAGRLVYTPDQNGNRIPDFSYCGYMASERPIPDVPVKAVVTPIDGDATGLIQEAIDYVAGLAEDCNGVRGAVLLGPGTYLVCGTIRISTSGLVLRGGGTGPDGTTIVARGRIRDTLIRINGRPDLSTGGYVAITDPYVPVNATVFRVADPNQFKPGDQVLVRRPCTAKWIEALGTGHIGGGIGYLGWKEGSRQILWDRQVVAVDKQRITIDAPLTMALDTNYGGGQVCTYNWPGRIRQIGIENLHLVCEVDGSNPKDEDHRWMAITMENAQDAWIRQVTFEHFAGSAVAIWDSVKKVTVEDCISVAPVSETGGQRRNTFLTCGQQVLFQRVYAEQGIHDLAVGFCAPGPNAFVQCQSSRPYGFSGGIDSWACGVLFDLVCVDGQALTLGNLGPRAQGAGWNAANCVLWNCSASQIDCFTPPTAYNWAFGCWAQFFGDGYWEGSNDYVEPRSLFYAQLQDRLGRGCDQQADLMPFVGESTTSPSPDLAARLTAQSKKPPLTLRQWIMQASLRRPIPTGHSGARIFSEATSTRPQHQTSNRMQLKNGWLVCNGRVMTGSRIAVQWWSGGIRPMDLAKATPHITRFVPGRYGPGLTDELPQVAQQMIAAHQVAIEHNYGLWYDRRRDDHERVFRIDGDVWPPFYEQPFARSGTGTAYDGLSLYDLTKYNAWYWQRLKEFADLADQKGLILMHHHYFQHHILEAGAHWTDCPWRPANNINDTGFPEPPPYIGDKRIFLAEQFYDVNHPVRRPIHQAYIRKCLDNFSGNSNVMHIIGQEFTGPLHFVRFWIDQIINWQTETGTQAVISLSATKDVQDAILDDPVYGPVVDVIDIRYWHYRSDGILYAPEGGKNLAPRQHARLVRPGSSSRQQVYRAVRQYRERFPEKAVIYSADLEQDWAWAVFMAGGSLAPIPVIEEPALLAAAADMHPMDLAETQQGQWVLTDGKGQFILYCWAQPQIPPTVDRPMRAVFIHPGDGRLLSRTRLAPGERPASPTLPVVVWLVDVD